VLLLAAAILCLMTAWAAWDWYSWRECLDANPWWYCARVLD
jgi:hypothetical protein